MNWKAEDTGVVITMAGAGSRFAQAGYTVPKYEIQVRGRSLFAWSLESLRSFIDCGCHFIFIARNMPGIQFFVDKQCRDLGIGRYRLLLLDRMTDGQATTALLARDAWDESSRPVAIYNIDTYVRPSAMPVSAIRGNGWIPCFPGEGDKWSFAAVDETGRASTLREKVRISPHATVGLYWFDAFGRYVEAYERYYAAGHGSSGKAEASERYIAPLYNQLIEDGADVYIHEIPAADVHPLGTPEDVARFAAAGRPDAQKTASGSF